MALYRNPLWIKDQSPISQSPGSGYPHATMTVSETNPAQALVEANRRFYDALWAQARLVEPERFNTWPIVQELLARSPRRLEIAPGLRPRLPIEGTHFVDISTPALRKLRERGGKATVGPVTAIPFPDAAFDLVCALDIVEHVDDDEQAWAEVTRVAASGASVLISTPLHPEKWTKFDDFVGHRRRYEPDELMGKIAGHGLVVERSAVYGMQPRSSVILDLGMWWLTHRREEAMRWYNRIWMPMAVRFEKKLTLVEGLVDFEKADEVLLVCRKA